MIAVERLTARSRATRARPASLLRDVTFRWERGVLGVLGAPADGTSLLLEVLAGVASPKSGAVRLKGRAPADLRARVAHVPLEVTLPEAMRVDEVCALSSSLRGEPRVPAAERLAPLGLAALERRATRSLSRSEARSVALALALTSRAEILLVEEPLAWVDPALPARVLPLLRERAATRAVVVTTASVRDATALADALMVLTAGALAPLSSRAAHESRDGALLRVVVAGGPDAAPRLAPLIAILADDPAVTSVETASYAGRSGAALVLAGRDLLAVAGAVARASARARVDVEAIEPAVAGLDTIRAALAAAPSRAAPVAPQQPQQSQQPQQPHPSRPPPPPHGEAT